MNISNNYNSEIFHMIMIARLWETIRLMYLKMPPKLQKRILNSYFSVDNNTPNKCVSL